MKHTLHRAAALLALTCALTSPLQAHALEIEGVKIDDTVKVAGKDLKLNGAGVRTRAIFKVYTLGLYLPKAEANADGALAAHGPRRVAITLLREVDAEEFGQAFMSGINANSDKAEKSRLVNQLVRLGELFQTIGSLKKGDLLTVDWLPDKGTMVEVNGRPQSDPLPDPALYNAILKIWLGDKPADARLKLQLLGGR